MDFLIVGNGMFGSAIARYLAPQAKVTVVGPATPAGGSGTYGAHHDEGRIIGDSSRGVIWSELNRRARAGLTELDPTLITSCGALTAPPRQDREAGPARDAGPYRSLPTSLLAAAVGCVGGIYGIGGGSILAPILIGPAARPKRLRRRRWRRRS